MPASSALPWDRVVAHVDMDSFYASVEVRDDPGLAGKPIVVGGNADGRGVVSSASYEAREFGIRSAMPTARALRLCPDLIVVPPRPDKYATASRILRGVFDEFSPLVEPLSLDEAFLELTGTQRLFGSPHEIGEAIRKRVVAELALTASVGIAPSKFVAKLASDHDKPDGLTVVPPDEVVAFVQSLPLERIWGVGPATLAALHEAGVHTVPELANADPERLEQRLGHHARRLVRLARGEDSRTVSSGIAAKSISHEVTFARDQADEGLLEGVLLGLAEKVARRARRQGVSGRTVTLKLRLPDFTTFTRSRTIEPPTQDADRVYRVGRALFRALDRKGAAVRLIGVGVSNLTEAVQLDLFATDESESPADEARRESLRVAEDAIIGRFGKHVLGRARTLVASDAEDTSSMAGRPLDEP
jgi:DNA polymerase-4